MMQVFKINFKVNLNKVNQILYYKISKKLQELPSYVYIIICICNDNVLIFKYFLNVNKIYIIIELKVFIVKLCIGIV